MPKSIEVREVLLKDIRSPELRKYAVAGTSISKIFLAVDEGQEQGVIHTGVYNPPLPLFVYQVFVRPEYRESGVGSLLLRFVEDFAFQNGNLSIELLPREIDPTFPIERVENWYQQRGFTFKQNSQARLEKLLK